MAPGQLRASAGPPQAARGPPGGRERSELGVDIYFEAGAAGAAAAAGAVPKYFL
jgi:hypothetical protein